MPLKNVDIIFFSQWNTNESETNGSGRAQKRNASKRLFQIHGIDYKSPRRWCIRKKQNDTKVRKIGSTLATISSFLLFLFLFRFASYILAYSLFFLLSFIYFFIFRTKEKPTEQIYFNRNSSFSNVSFRIFCILEIQIMNFVVLFWFGGRIMFNVLLNWIFQAFLITTNDCKWANGLSLFHTNVKRPFKSVSKLWYVFFLSFWLSKWRRNVIWDSVSVCRFLPISLVHTAIFISISLQRNWDSFFHLWFWNSWRKKNSYFFFTLSVFFFLSRRFALILGWMSLFSCWFLWYEFFFLFALVMLCATLFGAEVAWRQISLVKIYRHFTSYFMYCIYKSVAKEVFKTNRQRNQIHTEKRGDETSEWDKKQEWKE